MRNPEQMEIPRVELTPWAREELKVGPETGAEQFRQTLFERLEKESWLPATETQYALETLALRSAEDRKATVGVGGGSFFWSTEKKLREEVERFATAFFQLPPPQRTAEWRRLEERCRMFPTLAFRLRGLQPGLEVVIPQTGFDRATLDLAEHLSQLYTLRPDARAQRRRSPDERLTKTLPQWREAAARLQRMLPQVAALDAALVNTLATAKQRASGMKTVKAPLDISVVPTGGRYGYGDRGYGRPGSRGKSSVSGLHIGMMLFGGLLLVTFSAYVSSRATQEQTRYRNSQTPNYSNNYNYGYTPPSPNYPQGTSPYGGNNGVPRNPQYQPNVPRTPSPYGNNPSPYGGRPSPYGGGGGPSPYGGGGPSPGPAGPRFR